jgi:hypothetical protein
VQREAQPVWGRLCWVLLSQMQALIMSIIIIIKLPN